MTRPSHTATSTSTWSIAIATGPGAIARLEDGPPCVRKPGLSQALQATSSSRPATWSTSDPTSTKRYHSSADKSVDRTRVPTAVAPPGYPTVGTRLAGSPDRRRSPGESAATRGELRGRSRTMRSASQAALLRFADCRFRTPSDVDELRFPPAERQTSQSEPLSVRLRHFVTDRRVKLPRPGASLKSKLRSPGKRPTSRGVPTPSLRRLGTNRDRVATWFFADCIRRGQAPCASQRERGFAPLRSEEFALGVQRARAPSQRSSSSFDRRPIGYHQAGCRRLVMTRLRVASPVAPSSSSSVAVRDGSGMLALDRVLKRRQVFSHLLKLRFEALHFVIDVSTCVHGWNL